jgi:CO/xanthine dehydrogenase FAD-binding subunit
LDMRFEYLQPLTINETLDILADYNGRARLLAGGTDLMTQIDAGLKRPEYVVDIEGIPELNSIQYSEERGLRIGPTMTIRSVEMHPLIREKYPTLAFAAGRIGSVAIRNVGTIGGNVCTASPSADSVPFMMGMSGEVDLVKKSGRRTVPLVALFTGPGQTVMEPDEMLVEIRLPAPDPLMRSAYIKHSIRGSVDISIVSVAVVGLFQGQDCREVSVVIGSAAPTIFRAEKTESLLRGQTLSRERIQQAAQQAAREARPITDARGSSEYRKAMVAVLTERAIEQALGSQG